MHDINVAHDVLDLAYTAEQPDKPPPQPEYEYHIEDLSTVNFKDEIFTAYAWYTS